jgi:3-oxoacyl-[acyl-carrier protein] reductase
VVICSRTNADLRSAKAELGNGEGRLETVSADVSDPASVEALVKQAVQALPAIDILVNNAGVYGPIGALHVTDPLEWKRALEINLFGTYLCSRAVLPHMIARRRGCVVNLSGGGAVAPFPHFSAYSASKAAVVRLTETLAEEVREFGIRVNAIAPGPINTRLLDEVLAAGPEAAGPDFYQKALKQRDEGGVSPQLTAELTVLLASDAVEGLTGRLISTVWDDWKNLPSAVPEIMASERYTVRRIK